MMSSHRHHKRRRFHWGWRWHGVWHVITILTDSQEGEKKSSISTQEQHCINTYPNIGASSGHLIGLSSGNVDSGNGRNIAASSGPLIESRNGRNIASSSGTKLGVVRSVAIDTAILNKDRS